jgi:uroporphyrinogen-III synthase
MAQSSGVRVLATRPEVQNRGWCQRLHDAGFATLPVPVLGIEPVQEPAQRQAIKNLILNFDHFDKVIFVSQNAVHEALQWLDEFWPQLPYGIEYFAVGQKTAQVLQEYGIAASSCKHAMDSDEMLAMPALQDVAGQKILLCRGRGGRPRLAEELEARGAQVSYGEFYERVLPKDAVRKLQQSDFGRAGYIEVLAAFSGESLDNLVQVLTKAGVQDFLGLSLLVPGHRVAAQATDLGFQHVIVAPNATDDAMLKALQYML